MGAAFGRFRAKEGTGLKQVDGKPQTQDGSVSGHQNFIAKWLWRNRDRVKSDGQSVVPPPRRSPVEEDDTNLAGGSLLDEEPVQDPVALPHFPMQSPNNRDGDQKLARVPLSHNAEKPGSYPKDGDKKLALPLPENRSLLIGKARHVPKQQLPPAEDIIVKDKPVVGKQFEESELLADILCTYDASKRSQDHPEDFSQEKKRQPDFGSLLIGDDSQEATQPEMPSLPKLLKAAKTTKPKEPGQDVSSDHTSVEVEAQVHQDEHLEKTPGPLPADVCKELLGAVSKRNSAWKQSPQVPRRSGAKPLPPARLLTSLRPEDHKNNVHASPCLTPIAKPQAEQIPTVLAEQTISSVDTTQGAKKLVPIVRETEEETTSAFAQSQEMTPPSGRCRIQKPLPVVSKADCSPPPTPPMGNVLKASSLSRKKKRPVDLPENESVSKALPKVPKGVKLPLPENESVPKALLKVPQGVKPPLPSKPIPSLLTKRVKRPGVAKTPSLGTSEKDEGSEVCKENQKKGHKAKDFRPGDNPGDGSEITPKQGSADGSPLPGRPLGFNNIASNSA